MNPPISCICTTFCRTPCLEEAVEYFLRQDYTGPLELIIINDQPLQRIFCNDKRISKRRHIKIINKDKRFDNLGSKRDYGIEQSSYKWIMTWGDDDIHLPWEVSSSMKWVLEHSLDMGVIGHYYFADGLNIKFNKQSPGAPFLMKKAVYDAVGGLEKMNVGEDWNLRRAVEKSEYKSGRMLCKPGFIYRWNNGHYHISGLGWDKSGEKTSWDIIGERMLEKMKRGDEPTGNIFLKPKASQDWEKLIAGISTE